MSATIAGKKQRQAAPAPTTGRGAALLITLGLVLLTMGCGWALSLLAAGDSAALQLFRRSAEGLAGPLCPGLILLALWLVTLLTLGYFAVLLFHNRLIGETMRFIRDFEGDIPGQAAKDCGNYLDMNLAMAQYHAHKYLAEALETMDEKRLNYPD